MWVKICGWNNPAILREALALCRPDAIGLNFFSKSARAVTVPQARILRECLPDEVAAVGVFVNHSREEIQETVEQVKLTHIQLHGDESPEFAASLAPSRIIRVYRLQEPNLSSIEADLNALRTLGCRPWACLVDAWDKNDYGGTGKVAPWAALQDWPSEWPPLILAGGLSSQNVGEAIRLVRPFGVDTASGVEVTKGCKDPRQVGEFVELCRSQSGS